MCIVRLAYVCYMRTSDLSHLCHRILENSNASTLFLDISWCSRKVVLSCQLSCFAGMGVVMRASWKDDGAIRESVKHFFLRLR